MRLADKAPLLGGGIFFGLMARAQQAVARGRTLVPLHLGDSHLPPPPVVALPTLVSEPGVHQYGAIAGEPVLHEAVSDKLARQGLPWRGPAEVQITCGATHALLCGLLAIGNPGDELVLPAPFWPLIRGIARTASLVPVELPLLSAGGRVPLPERVAAAIGPKTRAIYVASPNNPDGHVTPRAELEEVARLARRHDLWLLSDEVYEDLDYLSAQPTPLAALPGAAERTISVWSLSKSYALAGLRVGYLAGPSELVAVVRRLVTHTVYNVPAATQRAAAAALASGPPQYQDAFRRARDQAVAGLAALGPLPGLRAPDGGTFLFLELSRFGPDALGRLADDGVVLAPGDAFGAAYGSWARLCFTATSSEVLADGLSRMVRVLG